MKTMVIFLAVSGPKFTKFWDDLGDPTSFPTPFPDCLYHVPCQRYWPSKLPLSRKVIENRSTVFGPQFFAGCRTKNFKAICYRALPLPCGKVWWSSLV